MPQVSAAKTPASPAPTAAEPQPISLRALNPENKATLQQQEPAIHDVMDRARHMLLTYVPEIKSVLDRPGMQVVVVDDINKAWEQTHGRPPGDKDPHPLEAFTHTTVDPKTNQATGTTIYLSSAMFGPQRYNGGELIEPVPHVIAALDHELQLCRQSVHPPNGQAVVDVSLGRREQEAYAGQIRDLKRIYDGVSPLDVRDYRTQFKRENLDGEKIVDEKVDFRFLAGNLELVRQGYEKMAAKEAQGAMPVLPKVIQPVR